VTFRASGCRQAEPGAGIRNASRSAGVASSIRTALRPPAFLTSRCQTSAGLDVPRGRAARIESQAAAKLPAPWRRLSR
jgi:hypothetical protein